jgi:hypothetical protein
VGQTSIVIYLLKGIRLPQKNASNENEGDLESENTYEVQDWGDNGVVAFMMKNDIEKVYEVAVD